MPSFVTPKQLTLLSWPASTPEGEGDKPESQAGHKNIYVKGQSRVNLCFVLNYQISKQEFVTMQAVMFYFGLLSAI